MSDYEGQLRKLEAEVRNHIRIEMQLKLYFENAQQKFEEVEKEKDVEIKGLQKKINVNFVIHLYRNILL